MAIKLVTSARWFDFDKGEGVAFHLMPLTRSRLMALSKEADGDEAALQSAVWNEMLIGWRGIVDEDGVDLAVTDENKALIRENVMFTVWIDKHTKGYMAAVEAETKN